jgi:hypothetical protein
LMLRPPRSLPSRARIASSAALASSISTKAKPRGAGLAVRDDAHGLDGAVSSEDILEVCLGAREGKVADVDLLAHLIVLFAPARNPIEAR